MKSLIAAVILGTTIIGAVWAAETPVLKPVSTYADAANGFTLAPAFDPLPVGRGQTMATFSGPASEGFAPNANVVIMCTDMTMDVLVESCVAGYKKLGMTINSQKNLKVDGRDAVLFDCQGKTSGHDLRDLALAVLDAHRSAVITCTATPQQYEGLKTRFTACLESFKFTDAKP